MRLQSCGPNTHKYYYRSNNGKRVLEYKPDTWSNNNFNSNYCDLAATYVNLEWNSDSKYQTNLVCKRVSKDTNQVFFTCGGDLVRENIEF